MEPPGDAAAIADAGAEEKRRGWPRRPRQLQQWPQEGAGAERPPCVYCRCVLCVPPLRWVGAGWVGLGWSWACGPSPPTNSHFPLGLD